MSAVDDFLKLRWQQVAIALMLFLALVAPGLLLLYFYRPTDFQSLETFKLLLLALAITTPVFVFNFLIIFHVLAELTPPIPPDKFDVGLATLGVGFITCIALYLPLLAAYLLVLPFRTYLLATLTLNLVGLLLAAAFIRQVHGHAPQQGAAGDGPRPAGSAHA